MALEALSSNELLNFIIYDTISATPFSSSCNDYSSETTTTTTTTTTNTSSLFLENPPQETFSSSALLLDINSSNLMSISQGPGCTSTIGAHEESLNVEKRPSPPQNLGVQQGKKKRRRRPRVCKNKEEAETQRMTHIAVERNRRKQMNEHLAVLRSLMPESYVQRGDQASIVGGAIEFVKELEHLLQTLEAQKFLIQQQQHQEGVGNHDPNLSTPFSQFFGYPQYTCSQNSNKCTSKTKASIADIEVTLIETHANVRILSRKRLTQLSKMVACFQTLYLSILHLNVTTLDPLVLYSISAKVEEGCGLNSADEIAGAVHQMLRIIEEEAMPYIC